MKELAGRKCEACAPGTPPLEESRAAELHTQLDGAWERDGNKRLHRFLEFSNFREAFAFATRVALLAEAEGHHPDLTIGWGKAGVDLTTHVAGGLTDNDFILAAKIDLLVTGSATPRHP